MVQHGGHVVNIIGKGAARSVVLHLVLIHHDDTSDLQISDSVGVDSEEVPKKSEALRNSTHENISPFPARIRPRRTMTAFVEGPRWRLKSAAYRSAEEDMQLILYNGQIGDWRAQFAAARLETKHMSLQYHHMTPN